MAVYVVMRDSKPSGERHLDLRCLSRDKELTYLGKKRWRAADSEIAYTPNAKVKELPACHCLFDATLATTSVDADAWLQDLKRHDVIRSVYEVYDDQQKLSQIGMTSGSVHQRLKKRHDASVKRRLAPDAIWWLHDLLRGAKQPQLRLLTVAPGESLRQAEHRWREQRRVAGWQVTSHT